MTPLRAKTHLCIGLFFILGTGCALTKSTQTNSGPTNQVSTESKKKEKLELDPVFIKGDKPPRSAQQIFESAHKAYANEKYKKSIREYRLIIKYLEDSRYYATSLYNLGLAYEKLKRWALAEEVYSRLLHEKPESEEGLDAAFRLAAVYKKRSKPKNIIDLMTRTLLRDDLENYDRLEAYYRRSKAQLEMKNWQNAADGFRKVLSMNQKAIPAQRLRSDTRLIVKTYLYLGRCYHFAMSQIPLKLPPESMGEDLEKKARLLKSAQAFYFDALRQHHPTWSIAAGYELGQLYEGFYKDIYTAEIPESLSKKEVDVYFEELEGKIEPLIKRAIKVYRKNIELAERLQSGDKKKKWWNLSSRSLHHLISLLRSDEVRKKARRVIANGGSFDALWEPFDEAVLRVNKAIERATVEQRGQI